MKASLIMPIYNKLPRLKLVIASIIGQTAAHDTFEVIFVDDGSTDGTQSFFESIKLPFQYQYIRIQNSGRAVARNTAIQMAENEILIFVDDDVILHPSFVNEHLKEQEKGLKVVHGRILNLSYLKFFEDPTKGIFYPDLNMKQPSRMLIKKCISEDDVKQCFNEKFGEYDRITSFEHIIESIMKKGGTEVDWFSFSGGNTSVPKYWLDQCGYFDEMFGRVWGCEDLELGYRLLKDNRKFFYSYTARNYHIAHYRAKFKEEHSESLAYFYHKHNDKNILLFQEYVEEKLKPEEFINAILPANREAI